jgi:hypothetical protein
MLDVVMLSVIILFVVMPNVNTLSVAGLLIRLSICPFIHPSVHPSIHPSVRLYVHLSNHLSICLSVYLIISPSVRLSI